MEQERANKQHRPTTTRFKSSPLRTKSELDLRARPSPPPKTLLLKEANLRHYVSSGGKVLGPDELLGNCSKPPPPPPPPSSAHQDVGHRQRMGGGGEGKKMPSSSPRKAPFLPGSPRKNAGTPKELVLQRRKSYHFEDTASKTEIETTPEKNFQFTEEMKQMIRKRLAQLYTTTSQTSLPLFEKTADDVEANFSDSIFTIEPDSQGQFQKKFINLEDIFIRVPAPHPLDETSAPLKVLLEGYPGFGKTTLTCKLASDWNVSKPYLADQFDFVFMVQLRQLRGTIEDFLSSQLNLAGITSLVMRRILKRIQRDTLLILDGYDELCNMAKNFLYPILQGTKYSQLNVFLTSRPGMGLIRSYLSERYSSKNFSIPWRKIVFITGIDEEKQRKFLQKNLPSRHTAELVYSRIQEEMNEEMKEIYKCPLFLKLLTVLIRNYKVTLVTSKTELYKKVLTVMITQCLKQSNLIQEDINIFEPLPQKESRQFYHNLLLCLGKMAVDGLKDKTFFYKKEDILKYCKGDDRVFKLGLLSKTETFQKETNGEYYEPIHKSFLEFLAAFYLSSLDSDQRTEKQNLFISTVNGLMEKEVQPTNGSLFYQFLGGILGPKTELLFKAISPWSFRYFASKYRDYSYDSYHLFYPIWCILSEVDISENLLMALLPFIPVLWEVKKQKDSTKFFTTKLHAQLLRIGTEHNRTQLFSWHVDELVNLPEHLRVKMVKLEIGHSLEEARKCLSRKNITCHQLICRFVMGFNEHNWTSFLKILSHITMEKLNIIIDAETVNSVVPRLCQELSSGSLRDTTIGRLSCSLVQDENRHAITLIRDLVEANKITDGLQIIIQRASDDSTDSQIKEHHIESIFVAAGNSPHIRELSFINQWSNLDPKIDLSKLCVRDKLWTFFPIRNKIDFTIDQKLKKLFLIEEIEFDRLNSVNHDIRILSVTDGVKRLKCSSELLQALTRRIPLWTGFHTIRELNLKITDETYHEGDFDALRRLKNLRVLSLDLYWMKYDVENDQDHLKKATLSGNDADGLTSALLNTQLRYLEFTDVGGWNVPFVNRIVQDLLDKQRARERQMADQAEKRMSKSKPPRPSITISKAQPNVIQLRVLKIQFHDISSDDMLGFSDMFKTYLVKKLSAEICFLDPDEAQIKHILNAFQFKDGFQIRKGVEGLDVDDTLRVRKNYLYTDDDPIEQLSVAYAPHRE